jgi:SAM-dependent methyltransferase
MTCSIFRSSAGGTAGSDRFSSMDFRVGSWMRAWAPVETSPFIPPDATIVGIDISPAMLARAELRRNSAACRVQLRQMDVTCLDFPDNSFDAVVAAFLFCVLPDEQQAPALQELGRVVKPGCPIRLLEYVRPHRVLRRIMARLWEPWIAWAYGASFDRGTQDRLPEAGLKLVEARFVVGDLVKLISARAVTKSHRPRLP